MSIHSRPFGGLDDARAMVSLALSCFEQNLHNIALPYRLASWAMDDPENCRLWFTKDGDLVGWAYLNTPFWALDLVVEPAYESQLLPMLLSWAKDRSGSLMGSKFEHPCWFTSAFSCQQERIHILETAGWQCQADVGEDSWTKVLLRRDGRPLEKIYPPPPGYIVRPLRGIEEIKAYTGIHRDVFGTNNMTPDWRAHTLSQPGHEPALDIVVETPDGSLGAFCIGWVQRMVNGELAGQIEPLGCRKEFRNKALGRVALAAVMERMLSMGINHIYVETDNYRDTAFRLYESMGFTVDQDVLMFKMDLNKDS